MDFWSLLGLASKKDFDEMSKKLSQMTALVEDLIQQNNIMSRLINENINTGIENITAVYSQGVNSIYASDVENTATIIEIMKKLNETSLNDLCSIKNELGQKLAFTTDSLKALIANTDIQAKDNVMHNKNANKKLDEILNSIVENAESIKSTNSKEMEHQAIDIANAISIAINNLNEQGKNNNEKLKNIEMLSSKLLEAVKIIWVDNMVDDLKKVIDPTSKNATNKIYSPF